MTHELIGTHKGATAQRIRAERLDMGQALDDFYLALVHPSAFDFQAMPEGWQRAQRLLSGEYRRLEWQMKVQTLQILQKR